MNTSLTRQNTVLLLLLAVITVTFLPWLGDTLFNTKGEPREAIVAMSMINSGNYILPESYGADIPYKPPFLAWLIAGVSWLNGGEITEFTSRMPSAVVAIIMLVGIYLFFARRTGTGIAALTTVITFTSVEVFRAASACRVDMILTACTVMAIISMVESADRRGHPTLSISGIALMTCATLTKGPVGMILPCLVTGIYFLIRQYRVKQVIIITACNGILSLIIPALWYYAAWLEGGDRFLNLALEENFGRFTGTMTYDSHLNPWWYNIVTVVAGMAPWTLLALMSLWSFKYRQHSATFKYGGWPKKLFSRLLSLPPATRISLTAVATIFIFYCIPASKRSVYLLPLYPFLSYFVALLCKRLIDKQSRVITIYTAVIASVGLIVTVLVVGFHIIDPAPLSNSLKGAALDLVNGLYHTTFGIADITMVVICAIASAGTLFFTARKSHTMKLAGCIATTISIYWVLGATVLPRTLNPKSDIVIANAIRQLDPNVDHTYTFNSVKMMRYFSAAFYLDDRLRMFAPEEGSSQSVDTRTIELPDSGLLVVGEREFPAWQDKFGTVYTITDTLFRGSRKSADCRSIPLILNFRRNDPK